MAVFGWEAKTPSGPAEWAVLVLVLLAVAAVGWVSGGPATASFAGIAAVVGYVFDRNIHIAVAIVVGLACGVGSGRRASGDRSARRAIREGLSLLGGFLLYEFGRSRVIGGRDVALRHGQRVIDLERWVHLWAEPSIQRWALADLNRVRVLNEWYSRSFLAIVIGALFFLYVTDDETYRLFRTSLGISALLTVLAIRVFPTAPPRLIESSGILDTHALLGRHHGFVNEFAAVPSLHVGWLALTGYCLWRTVRSWLRWFWLVGLPVGMLVIVMATGNHYWFDGLAGVVIAVGPAILLARRERRDRAALSFALLRRANDRVAPVAKPAFIALTLGSLLAYLLIHEWVASGFTDYWGYMVAQISATILVAAGLDHAFRAEGGLSWHTLWIVAAVTWADTLGTAGHMYDRFAVYDKITHFAGVAALTAAAADVFRMLDRRGTISLPLGLRLAIAVLIGIAIGGGWEVYEYLGDKLFHTGRNGGELDTLFDLVSDSVGAIVTAMYLWCWGNLTADAARSPQPGEWSESMPELHQQG